MELFMKRRISFEIEAPEFIDNDTIQQWVEYQLKARPVLSDDHPMAGEELQADADSVLVVSIKSY